jgi:hypothetical protein
MTTPISPTPEQVREAEEYARRYTYGTPVAIDSFLAASVPRDARINELEIHKDKLWKQNTALLLEKESGQWDRNCKMEAEIALLRKIQDIVRPLGLGDRVPNILWDVLKEVQQSGES